MRRNRSGPPLVPVRAALGALATTLVAAHRRRLDRHGLLATAVIKDPSEATVVDEHGAVRSVQSADLTLPRSELDELWSPRNLERLARTYWRFLTRVTLGLVRVEYTEEERTVVLIRSPLRLLRFQKPEYEMDESRGIVRWRIEDGVLVADRGRGGDGYLQIDIERRADEGGDEATMHVDVEVANFYPAIASRIGLWVYRVTQSKIHVLVTHGFLRSLARLDLAESRVGRFADIDEVPDPPPSGEASPRRPARKRQAA